MEKRFLIVLSLFSLSCRETPVDFSPVPTPTYRIEGTVTDRFFNPIRNVDIALYYNFDFGGMDSTPVLTWQVTDSTQVIKTAVYDFEGRLRRVLSVGTRPVGPIFASWDGLDSVGVRRNGVFHVSYITDDTVRHSYVTFLDGFVATRTDSNGQYVIGSEQLPIGFFPVPVFSADSSHFFGNFAIDPQVELVFRAPIARSHKSVYLVEGVVSRFDVIIQ